MRSRFVENPKYPHKNCGHYCPVEIGHPSGIPPVQKKFIHNCASILSGSPLINENQTLGG
jgi:hypothetical protein